jgi:hypothetical protein
MPSCKPIQSSGTAFHRQGWELRGDGKTRFHEGRVGDRCHGSKFQQSSFRVVLKCCSGIASPKFGTRGEAAKLQLTIIQVR